VVALGTRLSAVAGRIERAVDEGRAIDRITEDDPAFDVPSAYDVLRELHARRVAAGWRPVGRKIGFTNVTIWERYGVDRPMWSQVWDRTLIEAHDDRAEVPLDGLVEPRIEPEIVFGLAGALPDSDDPVDVLRAVAWLAPGAEIVQSVFPGWKFAAPDCTAAYGLHGRLVVGARVAIDDANRARIAAALPSFGVTLRRGDVPVDTGVGANVLGSPAKALVHLRNVLAGQPWAPPLAAGELVTTGTITDAHPVAPGETWHATFGTLGVRGLDVSFR
jgi:2-oxo-3-hexenedioate decarboxylase